MVAAAKLDRLERVTDLVLVLLNTPQPLTLDAIANQVPGYPTEHAARRQAFERDKRLLRDEGIPVQTRRLEGAEQYGYLIERDSFYLPDLDLEADEQVALHLAVAGVHLGDPSGRDALMKLGASGLGDVRPVATLMRSDALIELYEAVRTHAAASFGYRGEPRSVAPVGLRFRFGHWYLVAWDLERAAPRTFRVDRIDGDVTRGEPGDAEVPEHLDIDAALPDEPWEAAGEDSVTMRIAVDAVEGPRVADEVGQDRVAARHDDGSVELAFAVTSFISIRSWVLGLLDHATILEPPEFRDELVAWLDDLAVGPDSVEAGETRSVAEPSMATSSGTGASGASAASGASGESGASRASGDAETEPPAYVSVVGAPNGESGVGGGTDDPTPAPRAPGTQTSGRLRNLLAMVGWLAQVGEASIAELSGRFGMKEKDLVAELELAACCGTPPYTPDTLMEIEVSEHSVRAFLPAEYARPRRLTPAEGFAVAASARMLLAVPGSDDDALRRALTKLESELGAREVVGLDVDSPPLLTAIRDATEAGRMLEIDYLSASRDELTTRQVEPVQAVTIDGHWYLDAYCHRAGDMRRFRVDRIRDARPLEQPRSDGAHRVRPPEDMYVPGPDAREVHLRLGPEAQWVPESVPVRDMRRADDGTVTDVVLDVSGLAWFERLLLQLGPAATVVTPPDLTGLAAEAARKVLVRYR
jgi:predicted DNA-binding transcriptional regulator YafY